MLTGGGAGGDFGAVHPYGRKQRWLEGDKKGQRRFKKEGTTFNQLYSSSCSGSDSPFEVYRSTSTVGLRMVVNAYQQAERRRVKVDEGHYQAYEGVDEYGIGYVETKKGRRKEEGQCQLNPRGEGRVERCC